MKKLIIALVILVIALLAVTGDAAGGSWPIDECPCKLATSHCYRLPMVLRSAPQGLTNPTVMP